MNYALGEEFYIGINAEKIKIIGYNSKENKYCYVYPDDDDNLGFKISTFNPDKKLPGYNKCFYGEVLPLEKPKKPKHPKINNKCKFKLGQTVSAYGELRIVLGYCRSTNEYLLSAGSAGDFSFKNGTLDEDDITIDKSLYDGRYALYAENEISIPKSKYKPGDKVIYHDPFGKYQNIVITITEAYFEDGKEKYGSESFGDIKLEELKDISCYPSDAKFKIGEKVLYNDEKVIINGYDQPSGMYSFESINGSKQLFIPTFVSEDFYYKMNNVLVTDAFLEHLPKQKMKKATKDSIVFKIGTNVIAGRQIRQVLSYDKVSNKYLLSDKNSIDGKWFTSDKVKNHQFKYKKGDIILHKYAGAFYESKITKAYIHDGLEIYETRKFVDIKLKEIGEYPKDAKFKLGESVLFEGKLCKILGYNQEFNTYVIEMDNGSYTSDTLKKTGATWVPKFILEEAFNGNHKVNSCVASVLSKPITYKVGDKAIYSFNENNYVITITKCNIVNGKTTYESNRFNDIKSTDLKPIKEENKSKFEIGEEVLFYGEKTKILGYHLDREYYIFSRTKNEAHLKFKNISIPSKNLLLSEEVNPDTLCDACYRSYDLKKINTQEYPKDAKFQLGEIADYKGREVKILGYNSKNKTYVFSADNCFLLKDLTSGYFPDFTSPELNDKTSCNAVAEQYLSKQYPKDAKFKLGEKILYHGKETTIVGYCGDGKYLYADESSPFTRSTISGNFPQYSAKFFLEKDRDQRCHGNHESTFSKIETPKPATKSTKKKTTKKSIKEYPSHLKFKLGDEVSVPHWNIHGYGGPYVIIGCDPKIGYAVSSKKSRVEYKKSNFDFSINVSPKTKYWIAAEYEMLGNTYPPGAKYKIGDKAFINGKEVKILGLTHGGLLRSINQSDTYTYLYSDPEGTIEFKNASFQFSDKNTNPEEKCSQATEDKFQENPGKFKVGQIVYHNNYKTYINKKCKDGKYILSRGTDLVDESSIKEYPKDAKFEIGDFVRYKKSDRALSKDTYLIVGYDPESKDYFLDDWGSSLKEWSKCNNIQYKLENYDLFNKSCSRYHEDDLVDRDFVLLKSIEADHVPGMTAIQSDPAPVEEINSVQDAASGKPSPFFKPSLLMEDVHDAGYRIAATQLIELVHAALSRITGLNINETFDQNVIKSIIALIVGHSLAHLNDERAQRLAKEFRVNGMFGLEESAVDLIINIIADKYNNNDLRQEIIEEKVVLSAGLASYIISS